MRSNTRRKAAASQCSWASFHATGKSSGSTAVLYRIRVSECQKSICRIYLKHSPVKTVQPKVEPSVLVSEWRSLKIWLISWAEDGVICVHMVNEADADYYDMILMDIQMPNMNGYDATRKIRELGGEKAEIPIVAMTANAFEADRKNAYAAGMNGHIAKPIEIPELMEALTRFLG